MALAPRSSPASPSPWWAASSPGCSSALGITIGGGLLGAIVNLLVGAVVLLISDRFVPGMRVKGFTGALVAALAIGVIAWLISLLLGAIGLA